MYQNIRSISSDYLQIKQMMLALTTNFHFLNIYILISLIYKLTNISYHIRNIYYMIISIMHHISNVSNHKYILSLIYQKKILLHITAYEEIYLWLKFLFLQMSICDHSALDITSSYSVTTPMTDSLVAKFEKATEHVAKKNKLMLSYIATHWRSQTLLN